LKVKDVMTKTVYRITDAQTLSEAAQLMWEHDCGWLPVVDANDHVVAALTDRDIAMAAFLTGQRLSDLPVAKSQSQTLMACTPTDGIDKAEEIMRLNRIRRLPVIDKSGRLVGVLSLNDIALAYQADREDIDAKALSDTLASICSHAQSAEPRAVTA
jgi:CBS-domain-containing membrane protein